jgi:hypothetical protein
MQAITMQPEVNKHEFFTDKLGYVMGQRWAVIILHLCLTTIGFADLWEMDLWASQTSRLGNQDDSSMILPLERSKSSCFKTGLLFIMYAYIDVPTMYIL